MSILALKNRAKLKSNDKYVICKICHKAFSIENVPDNKCPKCNIELEELNGFYDRHPELKVTKT